MSLNLYMLEYAVEVAKCGSISKAAQNLLLSQPHLSNTIKSVEQELGVLLFRRTKKGMTLTEEGMAFIKEAQVILEKMQQLQQRLQVQPMKSIRSSISVTRSYQVNKCVTQFINDFNNRDSFVMHVKETNPFQVVQDVYTHEAELGILHFFEAQKEFFINQFRKYDLSYTMHYEREFLIGISENSPLAKREYITKKELENYTVLIYGDYEIPSASYDVVSKLNDIVISPKRIYTYDRASAMEILKNCPNVYMWITGVHNETLKQYQLVLRRCKEIQAKNLGYSLYSKEYRMSWGTKELFERLQQIDWTEQII